MKNQTWIRNGELCIGSLQNFQLADDLRKLVPNTTKDGKVDESKRKVRVRKRVNGMFSLIVWDRTPGEPKPAKSKRGKRYSSAEMGIPASSDKPETRGMVLEGNN